MHNRLPKGLGKAIRFLRKEKGWSQEDLAIAAKVSQSLVSALELGTKQGTEKTRRKITKMLGWTYEAVLELAELMARGESASSAAAKIQILHSSKVSEYPFRALNNKRGNSYPVWSEAGQTKERIWVADAALAGRDHRQVSAHLVGSAPGVLALVDHSDREWAADGLFLCRLEEGAAPVLRHAERFPRALLLTGMEGEREAVARGWDKIVLGRVLWYQVNLALARSRGAL